MKIWDSLKHGSKKENDDICINWITLLGFAVFGILTILVEIFFWFKSLTCPFSQTYSFLLNKF